MKIAAMADLHLTGNLPYTQIGDSTRNEFSMLFLKEFFAFVRKNKVRYLAIPGDICHSPILNSEDLQLLAYFLNLVSEYNEIKTIISLGNHDLDGEKTILSFLCNGLLKPKNLFIQNSHFDCFFSDVNFYTMKYTSNDDFLEHSKMVCNLLSSQRERKVKRILLGHVSVKGTLHGSTKSIIGVKPEDIDRISKEFDLILFGHHHKHQWINDKSLYVGVPWQTRIDEIDCFPHGLLIELEDGEINIESFENPLSPRFLVIDDYEINPIQIKNSIVKPVLDIEKYTEDENVNFLKKIVDCNPYHLIVPRLKSKYILKEGDLSVSVKDSRLALLKIMKAFSSEKKIPSSYVKYTYKLWEEIKEK